MLRTLVFCLSLALATPLAAQSFQYPEGPTVALKGQISVCPYAALHSFVADLDRCFPEQETIDANLRNLLTAYERAIVRSARWSAEDFRAVLTYHKTKGPLAERGTLPCKTVREGIEKARLQSTGFVNAMIAGINRSRGTLYVDGKCVTGAGGS